MNNQSNELIHKYLLAIATEGEVRELERRLELDEELQDEFVLQAEIDAHLRQEVRSIAIGDEPASPRANDSVGMSDRWSLVSGISTLAAALLLAFFATYILPVQQAIAVPSLGQLRAGISWTEQNIWVAAATGDLPMLRAELQRGVSVDARSPEAVTPLQLAALLGRAAAAELLLDHNADVALTDNEGNTALHMAVFLGRTEVVRELLQHGADPLARNSGGFSPVEIAAAPWSEEYERHVSQAEAELNASLDTNRIRAARVPILTLLVRGDRGAQ